VSYHPEQKKSVCAFFCFFLSHGLAWFLRFPFLSLYSQLTNTNLQMPISIFLSRQSRDRIASLSRDSFDNNLKKKKKGKIHPSSPHVRLALSSSCYCTPDVYTVLSVLLSRYFSDLSPRAHLSVDCRNFSKWRKEKTENSFSPYFSPRSDRDDAQEKCFFLSLFFERNLRLERGDKNKIFPTKTFLCVCIYPGTHIHGTLITVGLSPVCLGL
jgi:hypothetical protein